MYWYQTGSNRKNNIQDVAKIWNHTDYINPIPFPDAYILVRE
jgi:hypothetical protein